MVKNKILKRIVAGLSCIALSTTMLTSLPAFADDYVDEYQYYSTLDPITVNTTICADQTTYQLTGNSDITKWEVV